jgi:hypothetical protein
LLTIFCPQCRKSFKGKDDLAGRAVICPACKAEFTVPLPSIPVKPQENVSDPLGFLNAPHNSPGLKQNQVPNKVRGCLILFLWIMAALFALSFALMAMRLLFSPLSTDPDLAAVRVYLHDNLDSGEWEEICWWPKRPVPAKFPGTATDSPYWKGKQVCLLKYRSGGKIHYEVFAVENGKAKSAWNPTGYDSIMGTNWALTVWAKYFPEETELTDPNKP